MAPNTQLLTDEAANHLIDVAHRTLRWTTLNVYVELQSSATPRVSARSSTPWQHTSTWHSSTAILQSVCRRWYNNARKAVFWMQRSFERCPVRNHTTSHDVTHQRTNSSSHETSFKKQRRSLPGFTWQRRRWRHRCSCTHAGDLTRITNYTGSQETFVRAPDHQRCSSPRSCGRLTLGLSTLKSMHVSAATTLGPPIQVAS